MLTAPLARHNSPVVCEATFIPVDQRHARTRKTRVPRNPRPPAGTRLGKLPEWDLSALYQGIDDPAVKRDLDRADSYSVAFEEDFKGKLAALADDPEAGKKLAQAVVRYEQLDDLLGRLISYAGLIHAGNTVDPARAKFYGDVQERITAASTHLLFFVLELNRLDDNKLEARWPIRRSATTGRGWRTSARTSPTSSRIASSSSSTRSR